MAVREPTARSFPHRRIRKTLSDGGRLLENTAARPIGSGAVGCRSAPGERACVGSSTPALAVGFRFFPSTRAKNWGRARPSPGPAIPLPPYHLWRVGMARPCSWHARFPRGRSLAGARPPASRVGQGLWRLWGRSDGPR